MSTTVIVKCDGNDCHQSYEADIVPDNFVSDAVGESGYFELDDAHYCKTCAPIVKTENGLEDDSEQ